MKTIYRLMLATVLISATTVSSAGWRGPYGPSERPAYHPYGPGPLSEEIIKDIEEDLTAQRDAYRQAVEERHNNLQRQLERMSEEHEVRIQRYRKMLDAERRAFQESEEEKYQFVDKRIQRMKEDHESYTSSLSRRLEHMNKERARMEERLKERGAYGDVRGTIEAENIQ